MHQETDLGNPIKFLRLNTGEDIITEVVFVKNEGSFYLCINPLKIVYNLGSKPDAMIVAFSPWIFTSICEKQEFAIFPSDVITIADPTTDIVECYKEFVYRIENTKLEMIPVKKQRKQELETDISEEEEEFLRNVLETIDKPKRRLH